MRPRVRLLRRLSTALLALWLLLVLASFVQRQLRRRPTVAPVDLGEVAAVRRETPVRVQKGFVYNDVLGVEPNFRVAARETVEFASGWYELREVEIGVFDRGAVSYALTAERARLNPTAKQAVASGEVQLSLSAGVAVHADEVSLAGADRVLQSHGGVTFAGPGWGGLAGRLAADLDDDLITLDDGVSISWRGAEGGAEPLIVFAPRLEYERRRGLLTFRDGLRFLRGGLHVRSARAEIQLDAAGGVVRELRLDQPVEIDGVLASGGRVGGSAGVTTIDNLPGGRTRVTALPLAGTGWVTLQWADADGSVRELTTWRLTGEGSSREWEWLEGQELVCARDLGRGAAPREVVAHRVTTEFTAGRAKTARAVGDVRVDLDGGRWAEGEELTVSLARGSFTLLPGSDERVTAGSGELSASAQRVESGEEGTIVATGQVQGTIRRNGGTSADVTRFAAERATLEEDRIVLEDDARLWQADRLIRADTLEYDREAEVVHGRGNVLTTGPTATRDGGDGAVRITASSLEYDRQAGAAQYDGDVTVEDATAISRCRRLAATLGSDGRILYATLAGGVTIEEPATGRIIRGEGARVIVARDVVQVWGQPVTLEEPGGNRVSGDMITWDRGASSMLVEGSEDRPSETIYVPTPPATPGREGEGGDGGAAR